MRDYAKVAPQFWTGTTGKAIRAAGRDAQVVALYLITSPSANMIGLYYLPLPTLCHEVGISRQGASKALRSLFEGGFATYDQDSEIVFVPEMAKFQLGPTLSQKDNRWKAVTKELAAFKSCRFIKDFYDRYASAYHLPEITSMKPLPSPFEGASEPLRSQEQEQEQEQERTTTASEAAASGPSLGEYLQTFDTNGQEILRQIVTAIARTRKTGRVAQSVLDGVARKLARYPQAVVLSACQTYLDRDCAGEGKDERYLLGIIRGELKRASPNGSGPAFDASSNGAPEGSKSEGQLVIERAMRAHRAERGW